MIKIHNNLILILLALACCIISCSHHKEQELLDRAEKLIESYPDSVMILLSSIDMECLSGDKQKAQYAILMSMALDKNYIDTTTFDVLQPAIDYYLRHGNANEKLRTYYYQGRIFQNQGDRDRALNSFIKGIDLAPLCSDSLCIARTFVAAGGLYDNFYGFENYTNCYLKAANIYRALGRPHHEFDCLLNALNGSIMLNNRSLGDSIINICNSFDFLNDSERNTLHGYNISYVLSFGSNDDLKKLVSQYQDSIELDTNGLLNLATAHNVLGNNNQAKDILKFINDHTTSYDTLKYQAVKFPILKSLGEYNEALAVYQDFSRRIESINTTKFIQKAKAIEEKYKIELKTQEDARNKSRIIWGCIGSIAILSLVIIILCLLVRSHKAKKELALVKVKTRDAENYKLKSEKEILTLENKNLQLERDKKSLEAENLAHRVDELENESESLKALIVTKEELPLEVQKEIKIRIEMLNSLLASYITANDQYEKPYDVWIKELTENKAEFMNSNRLAFLVSHPRFIKYFEDHKLTIDEINYVCLYAIGLRGKEVGNYMKKRSHVNTSSIIRKKLGIDRHETNIGIYVRKLLKSL